jgi:predicted deacetylase
MPSKFILRFDDITPEMAWSKFSAFDALSRDLNISLLVGVVPHCLDSKLAKEPANADFWDVVRGWVNRGWTIAQHGYTHQYVTKVSGILGITNQSELAGLSYEEQYAKMKAGKDILAQQNVWQPVFMAPSHSFDNITLQVLSDLDFRYLTDGYGVYPYKMGALTAVPQLFATPKHLGFGVYTICLHVNSMTQPEIQKMLCFMREHRKQFISFSDATAISSPIPGVAITSRFFTSSPLRIIRNIRQQIDSKMCAG